MMAFLQSTKNKTTLRFCFLYTSFVVFHLQNEHKRKLYEKLQRQFREITKIERRKVRELKRTLEFFQHFAFVV
jgi:hypothetical protein